MERLKPEKNSLLKSVINIQVNLAKVPRHIKKIRENLLDRRPSEATQRQGYRKLWVPK